MKTNSTPARATFVVYAKDIERVAEFYRRTLNIAALEETSGFILLAGDGTELSVVRIPDALAETIAIVSPPVVRENTPMKVSFWLPSLSAVRDAATSTGGGLRPPETAWTWRGMLHIDGFDPEGNVVQFRSQA